MRGRRRRGRHKRRRHVKRRVEPLLVISAAQEERDLRAVRRIGGGLVSAHEHLDDWVDHDAACTG
eukprot:11222853-Lingulodinium_polyedra.AAC.1